MRGAVLETSRQLVFLKIKCSRENCYNNKFFFGTIKCSTSFVSSDIAVVLLLDFSTALKNSETVIKECKTVISGIPIM